MKVTLNEKIAQTGVPSIGFVIEHYADNLPLWLAPEQVRVLTIGDEEALVNYAKAIVTELRANFVRVDADYSANKINGKIQDAEKAKIHTMLIIGGRDMEVGNVSVRLHGKGARTSVRRGAIGVGSCVFSKVYPNHVPAG